MKLPRFTAGTPPPRSSGLARATDIGALTQTGEAAKWQGVGAIGGAMQQVSDVLFRTHQHRHIIDTRLQHAQVTSDYEGYVGELTRSLSESVVQTPNQRDSIHKGVMAKVDKYYQQRIKDVDNEDARQAIKISWQQDKVRYKAAVWRTLTGQLNTHQTETGLNVGEKYLQNGRVEEAIEHYRFLAKNGILTSSYAQELISEAPEKAEKYLIEYGKQIIWNNALNSATDSEGNVDWQGVLQFLNQPKNTKGLGTDEVLNLVTHADKQYRIQTIITDQVAKTELESMAYNVRTGAMSIEDFQIELNEALGETINKDAYDEIFEIAQAKPSAYQNQSLKTVIDEAERELIDVRTELDVMAIFQTIKTKDERERILSNRQAQFWWHGQYRRALNQWFNKNPDATDDEIYIQSKKLLSQYRGKTIDEIRAMLGKKQKELLTVFPKAMPEMLEAVEKSKKIRLEEIAEFEKRLQKEKYYKYKKPFKEISDLSSESRNQAIKELNKIYESLVPEKKGRFLTLWNEASKAGATEEEFLAVWRKSR